MNKKVTYFLIIFVSAMLLTSRLPRANAQSADTTPPSTPTGLSASIGQSPSQVYISWSPSTDNVGVIGYYLYRNGQLIENIPGFTYYNDNITVGGTYFYSVAAYDAAGNISPQSGPAYVTVVEDTTPPSVPTGLTTTWTASSSITLSWNPSTDNVGVVGYYIYRNNTKLILPNVVNGSSYVDSGLSPGTYAYSLTAYDAAGNISERSAVVNGTVVFDITPPSIPTGLSISTSTGVVMLSWNPSTDNVGVVGYNVYRNGSDLGTISAPPYQDSGLSPATTYSYTVSAYDLVGNTSAQSVPSKSITTAPLDTTPPSIPTNLYGTPVSSSEIDLTWSPSTDNVAVAGYNVYQDGTLLGTTASTSFADTNLATSTTYTFAITAYDAAGNVSPQTSVAAKTLSYTPAVIIVNLPPTPLPTSTTPPPATVSSTPPSYTPPPASTNPGFTFTTSLYYGLRGGSVLALQTFLIQDQYLGAAYNTGFYGLLTQKAVQKFQCTAGIVCSGSPTTTGWGSIGPRTRKILNQLY